MRAWTVNREVVTWCFTPSQPLRLYQGDVNREYLFVKYTYSKQDRPTNSNTVVHWWCCNELLLSHLSCWYTGGFGCMVKEDRSNLMRFGPSVLNVLAAARYNQNWQFKARASSMYLTLLLHESYHPVWPSAFLSPQSIWRHSLAGGSSPPFGI